MSSHFDEAHQGTGGGGGSLGYPTGPARYDAPDYSYQTFERGVVYCSPRACAEVQGGFLPVHASTGGGTGRLGYPTGAEHYDAWNKVCTRNSSAAW